MLLRMFLVGQDTNAVLPQIVPIHFPFFFRLFPRRKTPLTNINVFLEKMLIYHPIWIRNWEHHTPCQNSDTSENRVRKLIFGILNLTKPMTLQLQIPIAVFLL